MNFDIDTLAALRRQHPAWRLLAADSAPLVASFLQRSFVAPNRRVIAQAELAAALDDVLYTLRQQPGEPGYPKPALDYLNDWAANDKAWLRKFYPSGSDEPHFDLTPATERALTWLAALSERSFVGTESRLLTLFELLRQMSSGSETDPALRLRELERRRAEIDAEIDRVQAGELLLLGDTALKERFAQFTTLARELLADFREVEHNFRALDRRVRERITLWDGAKGALLNEILGERDQIDNSDQGRSFRAFWDFLMSRTRQDELSALLDHVLALAPVAETAPDPRLKRVHYDWLEAGEHAQRTVALLSQQLRRFLDDQAYLENRRIMDILRGIEAAGPEYRAMLDKLNADDLPRFVARFKELLNENTIREVANFQSQLHRERETIKERIAHINESLTQIDYNPGRTITLEAQASADIDVRDFQTELRACTEGALTGSDDAQYSEAKFLQVRRIIERFRGRDGTAEPDRRWTAKVTDVRNWFVFAASERWRDDGREHEHYPDSGGKSGGQKEKLAYTILAASLAYQFGLEWGAALSRSFRFVVIDEAFGRGSDESAEYGLQLFDKLRCSC